MNNIICKFCRQNSVKAKEHIWPKWLQKKLTGNTKSSYISGSIGLFGMHSQRLQSGNSLVFGNICKECNNGWMSKLENDFKNIFEKLRKEYPKMYQLSKNERKSICLWALKTAMMINSGTNYKTIIPENHYKNLYTNKQIPKDTKIEITFINSNEMLSWRQSNIQQIITKKDKSISSLYKKIKKETYLITMQIEHIGIKIIYCKDYKKNGYNVKTINNKSLRIWPFKKNGKVNINNSYPHIESFHFDTLIEA